MPVVLLDVPKNTWAIIAPDASDQAPAKGSVPLRCQLLGGGSVEQIGVDPQFGVLLRYRPPSPGEATNAPGRYDGHPSGVLCGLSRLVFVPLGTTDNWPQKGTLINRKDQGGMGAATRRLLDQYERDHQQPPQPSPPRE